MTRYIAPSDVVNFMGQMTLPCIRLLPATTEKPLRKLLRDVE